MLLVMYAVLTMWFVFKFWHITMLGCGVGQTLEGANKNCRGQNLMKWTLPSQLLRGKFFLKRGANDFSKGTSPQSLPLATSFVTILSQFSSQLFEISSWFIGSICLEYKLRNSYMRLKLILSFFFWFSLRKSLNALSLDKQKASRQ